MAKLSNQKILTWNM